MNMKKQELRRIAQQALVNEFGFSPSLNAITLLEANGAGTYILFRVNGHRYRFDSYIMSFDGAFRLVWTGDGTISRC